jgi:hypothetical protein
MKYLLYKCAIYMCALNCKDFRVSVIEELLIMKHWWSDIRPKRET